MAKLLVLSGPLAGQSYELKVDKTTVGRVEDNTFQIADPSVSSHHCEIHLQSEGLLIKDLNSTNGSFINGEKITEATLKAGQTLKLGQVELRIDDGTVPAPAKLATAPASGKPRQDQTMVMQRGVSLDQLTEPRSSGFDTAGKGFTKKSNSTNRYFLIGGVIIGVIILIGLLIAWKSIK
jgi:pSer/pThr/pTyr-binding forkhead associated (FHA) protein